MKQLAFTAPAAAVLFFWLYDFVSRLLVAVWPVAYICLIAILLTATGAALAAIVRAARPPTQAEAGLGVLMETTAPAPTTAFKPVSQYKFTEAQLTEMWNREILIFCFLASCWYQDDFSNRKLAPAHTTDSGWRTITGLLTAKGILVKTSKTGWGRGWDYYRLRVALKHHLIKIDLPRDDLAPYSIKRPPTVSIDFMRTLPTNTTPHTPTTEATR